MTAPPPAARCDAPSGHCITCSDEGIPMRVVELGAEAAVCTDADGATHEVALDLLDGVTPGATVLVHAGVAIGWAP
jgi:hydrogenase expression/formation protein HypC